METLQIPCKCPTARLTSPKRQRIDGTEIAIRTARAETLAEAVGRTHLDHLKRLLVGLFIGLADVARRACLTLAETRTADAH